MFKYLGVPGIVLVPVLFFTDSKQRNSFKVVTWIDIGCEEMVVSVTELLDADQFHFLFQGNTGKVISQLLLYLGRVTEIRAVTAQ